MKISQIHTSTREEKDQEKFHQEDSIVTIYFDYIAVWLINIILIKTTGFYRQKQVVIVKKWLDFFLLMYINETYFLYQNLVGWAQKQFHHKKSPRTLEK